MKTASPALIALLNTSQQFLMCDLVEFTTLSGTQRWTNAGVPVTVDGLTYGVGPLIKRTGTRTSIGLTSDEMTIDVSADSSHLLEGLPFISSALAGALDRARVVVKRAFLTDWSATPVGTLLLFSGRVSNVRGSRSMVTISVKSDVELLATPFPRNLVQPPCVNTLWAPGCGAQRAAYTSYNAASAGSTASKVVANFARRNLLTRTQEFDGAIWGKAASGTASVPVVTANAGEAPDGTMTADRIQFNKGAGTTTADHSIVSQNVTGMTVGSGYADSVWMKTFDGSTKEVRFDANGLGGGTVTVNAEWKRFDFTWTADVTARAIKIALRGAQGTSDTADLLVWGAQRQLGVLTAYQAIGASFVAPPTTAGYYDQGVVEFTSGANAGLRRTVKSFDGTNLFFALPLPVAPAVGDGFILTPGCDKKKDTCGSKFANSARFKAMPYVPVAETAY